MHWAVDDRHEDGHSMVLEDAIALGVAGLDAVLDCDSVIVRLRSGDEGLATYVACPEVLHALARAALCCGAAVALDSGSREQCVRRALLACEILCSEHGAVVAAVQRSPDAVLAPFWEQCAPPNAAAHCEVCSAALLSVCVCGGEEDAASKAMARTIASACWTRILHMGVSRVPTAMGQAFLGVQDMPSAFAGSLVERALDSPPVVDGVVRLFASLGSGGSQGAFFAWLRMSCFFEHVLARPLCAPCDTDQLLGAVVAHAYPEAFPLHLLLRDVFDALCDALGPSLEDAACNGHTPSASKDGAVAAAIADVVERVASSAMETAVDAVSPCHGSPNGGIFGCAPALHGSPGAVSRRAEHARSLARHMAMRLAPEMGRLAAVLRPGCAAALLPCANGQRLDGALPRPLPASAARLGMLRLRTVQLMAAAVLLCAHDDTDTLADAMADAHVPARLAELLFAFPSHSVMHCAVEDYVRRACALLGTASDDLVPGPAPHDGAVAHPNELAAHATLQDTPMGHVVMDDTPQRDAVAIETPMHAGLHRAAAPGRDAGRRLPGEPWEGPSMPATRARGHVRLLCDMLDEGDLVGRILEAHARATPMCRPPVLAHAIRITTLLAGAETRLCHESLQAEAWRRHTTGPHLEAVARANTALGGPENEPPPSPPATASDSEGSDEDDVFRPSANEELARYFCQQVLATLPDRFRAVLAAEDDLQGAAAGDGDDGSILFVRGRQAYFGDDDYGDDDRRAADADDARTDEEEDAVGGGARHFVFDEDGHAIHVDADGRPIPGIAIPLPGMFVFAEHDASPSSDCDDDGFD